MAQLAQSPPGRLPLLWPGPASPLPAPSSLCPGPPLASAAASRQPDLRVLASGLPCTRGLPSPHKGPPSLARALPPGVLLLAGPLGPHTQPSTERPTPSTTLRAQESTSHIFLTSPPPHQVPPSFQARASGTWLGPELCLEASCLHLEALSPPACGCRGRPLPRVLDRGVPRSRHRPCRAPLSSWPLPPGCGGPCWALAPSLHPGSRAFLPHTAVGV